MRLRSRRYLAAISILTLLLTGVAAAPASARTNDDVVVASGEDWTVERAPGGYVVTLHLDEPIPVISDAPTIVVDGEPLGIARTSDGGRTLTITTFDGRVASAGEVVQGWASGPKPGDGTGSDNNRRAPVLPNDVLDDQLRALAPAPAIPDPSEPGPYTVTEAEYDFGDRSVPLADYGGIRGEMMGKLYVSSAPGERPVVVFMHGRHHTCGDASSGESQTGWPCPSGTMVIRSYLGYEGTARALASHGYNVVSVSVNAINATDSDVTFDQGARARGTLVLDALAMLESLNAGQTVTFEDQPDAGSVSARTFDDALASATTRSDHPAAPSGLTAANLAGRFDLARVGLMGHSRGGEGVVAAAQLNVAAQHQYGILSVLPLAPTDFARRTLSDVTTMAVLPYCDGDIGDQQGQKYIDDSRHAFDDNVLRSAVWVMGANHNFFNTVWTPGAYPAGGEDDWNTDDTTSACSTLDPTRLNAADQYQVGVTLMTGFFRSTLGGETQFLPLFDGTTAPTTDRIPFADIRVIATQARSQTTLVTDFVGTNAIILTEDTNDSEVCEGPQNNAVNPRCVDSPGGSVPHWNPGFLAPLVPLYPVYRFRWNDASTPALRVIVPDDQRDVSAREQLTLKVAPTRDVVLGTDFAIVLVDGSGAEFSVVASSLNPYAINRMPGGAEQLDKTVLQQVTLPLGEVIGVDLTDLREVRIEADGTANGGLFLSDLAFDSPSAGAPTVVERSSVNMAITRVEEGAQSWDASVAVWLDRPSDEPVVAYVGAIPGPGALYAPVQNFAQRVTFAPGETCLAVPVLITGNSDVSVDGVSVAVTAATTSQQGVSGASDFSAVLVREDDGVSGGATAPPFGEQGDVCAELAASRTPGELALSDADPARGDSLRLTATGFRVGEAVLATVGGVALPAVVAGADGTAVIDTVIASDAPLGEIAIVARGAGSDRVQQATATVRAAAPTPTPTRSTTTAVPVGSSASALANSGANGIVWGITALAAALLVASGTVVNAGARRRRER